MEKEAQNPEFAFLYNLASPEHAYYRWRLFSLSQGAWPSVSRYTPAASLPGIQLCSHVPYEHPMHGQRFHGVSTKTRINLLCKLLWQGTRCAHGGRTRLCCWPAGRGGFRRRCRQRRWRSRPQHSGAATQRCGSNPMVNCQPLSSDAVPASPSGGSRFAKHLA